MLLGLIRYQQTLQLASSQPTEPALTGSTDQHRIHQAYNQSRNWAVGMVPTLFYRFYCLLAVELNGLINDMEAKSNQLFMLKRWIMIFHLVSLLLLLSLSLLLYVEYCHCVVTGSCIIGVLYPTFVCFSLAGHKRRRSMSCKNKREDLSSAQKHSGNFFQLFSRVAVFWK